MGLDNYVYVHARAFYINMYTTRYIKYIVPCSAWNGLNFTQYRHTAHCGLASCAWYIMIYPYHKYTYTMLGDAHCITKMIKSR